MEKMIAYCGLNCFECPAYMATQNNDQALKEKTALEWSKMYNFTFTPEMINCTSCKSDGAKVGHCLQCEIRKCASGKNYVNCGLCKEFSTCKTINDFIVNVPHAKDNLLQNR